VKDEQKAMRVLYTILRPAFAICLFLSQFDSSRTSFFTANPYLLSVGVILFVAGVSLSIGASIYLKKAIDANEIAVSGPFRYVRHPIYASMYVLSVGLGFIFFAWLWFLVMAAFISLWYLECRNEEKEMVELYGPRYIDYQKRTGMLFPKVTTQA